ncbi:hypothetical protein [Actinoplanes sp. NPDC049681]|uniref:hypothetical protein n=1 Tax=Actinoplanes sp. NPDC049681 TaxID=3363905 RepID=UPI0037A9D5C3
MGVKPKALIKAICPAGTEQFSLASSGPIGTAYGKWLGCQYVLSRMLVPPGIKSYVMVDFGIWRSADWLPMTIYDLGRYDPRVVLALTGTDWSRRGLQRTDILDSDLDHVYEIKPRRRADEGPPQLARYLDQLRLTAPETASILQPDRKRNWQPGTWDPSPYVLVIPSITGEITFFMAEQDVLNPGVIIYDIIKCRRKPDEQAEELADTSIVSLVSPMSDARPQLTAVLARTLPRAPTGSTYAFIVPERFFQLFVIGAWDREIDRKIQSTYGIRPGPALTSFVLSTWAGAFFLNPELATAAALTTGYLPTDEIERFYGITLAIRAVASVAVLIGPDVGFAAAAVGETVAATAAPAVTATTAVEAIGTAAPVIASELTALSTTVATGAGTAVSAGAQLAPWMIGGGAATGSGASSTSVGLVAMLAVGLISADADAATRTNPGVPPGTVAADPVYLVPTELLVPRRGRIEAGAEVSYGDERYFIIGVVKAER